MRAIQGLLARLPGDAEREYASRRVARVPTAALAKASIEPPAPALSRTPTVNGSAHSLPKWTEQATIPGYHAASLTAVSPRSVWGERSEESGRIASVGFEGRCSIQLSYGRKLLSYADLDWFSLSVNSRSLPILCLSGPAERARFTTFPVGRVRSTATMSNALAPKKSGARCA